MDFPQLDLRQTNIFNSTAGDRTSTQGQSLNAFLLTIAGGAGTAGIELFLFLLIKDRLPRILYAIHFTLRSPNALNFNLLISLISSQPKTYLVAERERAEPVPPGLWQWIKPIFKTSTTDFLQKCGLDAYFFLRYQLLLLKVFVPIAVLILPTLLPLNWTGGNDIPELADAGGRNITQGLDRLAIANIAPQRALRLWAHCVLAVLLVCWVGFTMFFELKRYIRIRQAYLTSPQHRLRASATTVLVRAIPAKWLSVEALDGLFDVFPGGVKNIWINRNYDELNDRLQKRDKLMKSLESAETELVKKCRNVFFDR